MEEEEEEGGRGPRMKSGPSKRQDSQRHRPLVRPMCQPNEGTGDRGGGGPGRAPPHAEASDLRGTEGSGGGHFHKARRSYFSYFVFLKSRGWPTSRPNVL